MCKVLLLDKDEVVRMLYREALEEEGFSAIDTGRYEMFCEMIEEESPDILVMSADQDPRAALDLLQTVRGLYDDLPVILCTSDSRVKNDPKALSADCVLFKGVGAGESLKNLIRRIQNSMIPLMGLRRSGRNVRWGHGERESWWNGTSAGYCS